MSVFSRVVSNEIISLGDPLYSGSGGVVDEIIMTDIQNSGSSSGGGGFNGTVGYDSTTGEITFGGSVDTNGDNNNVSETGIPNVQFDDKTIIVSYLKRNWYWFVGVLIAVATALYFIMKPKNNKKKR